MSSRHLNSLIDSLLLRAENQPHQPLYYFLDTRGREYAHLTYASLLTAVQQLATWLSEKTASGDRVTIQLPTSPEFVITFFACLYTNRIPVPLSSPNRKHNCEHYQRIFTDCDASLVVTDATVQDLFVKEGLEPSHQIETFPSLETLDPILTPVDRQSNKIAFLQYTSGSTSFPKGVMVSHENIIANQKMIQRTFGHSSNSIGLAWVPLFHDVAYNGAEHIKLHTLEQFSNTFAPYGFKKFAFLPCYGLAEATLIVSGTDKSEEPLALTIPCSGDEVLDADASPQKGHTRTVVSNGQIMPELSLRIINPQTLKECASHHIGEIWISGTSITPGYWQQPDKNQETFVYRDGLRFLRTGDLGFLDSQQRLYITGRLKDLIVIDGKNYYPQDIEETVKLSHPALNKVNCAVFSVSGTYAQRLVVVNEVVRQFAVQIYRYADEIKQAVQIAVYNHYQLTVHDTVLLPSNTIPRTTSGKIQRQRTKLLYLLQQLETLETVKESI